MHTALPHHYRGTAPGDRPREKPWFFLVSEVPRFLPWFLLGGKKTTAVLCFSVSYSTLHLSFFQHTAGPAMHKQTAQCIRNQAPGGVQARPLACGLAAWCGVGEMKKRGMREGSWRALDSRGGFHAAAAAGCCGDRSQGNSFAVRALDRSAKKVAGRAAPEICVYSSLITCMHVDTRHCDLRRLWTLAIATVACGRACYLSRRYCELQANRRRI